MRSLLASLSSSMIWPGAASGHSRAAHSTRKAVRGTVHQKPIPAWTRYAGLRDPQGWARARSFCSERAALGLSKPTTERSAVSEFLLRYAKKNRERARVLDYALENADGVFGEIA